MAMRLTVNIGFITNSSFAVYHFPRELLENPKVKAFFDTYELHCGFVGYDVTCRNTAGTIAMTAEQRQEVCDQFQAGDEEYADYGSCYPKIDPNDEDILIIFGDEYDDTASNLAYLMREVADELGIDYGKGDYH